LIKKLNYLLCLYKQTNNKQVRVTTVGNSVGVIFPKELMEKLCISKGDTLYVLETPNGFELKLKDPDFVQQMEAAEAVMCEDRNVLRSSAN